jgi:hypothetical protein
MYNYHVSTRNLKYIKKKTYWDPGEVAYTCDPSTWIVEAGGL